MTINNKIIKEIITINDILSRSIVLCKNFITQKLKYLGEKEGYIINDQFNNRLKNTIYSWYVDSDFLLHKFLCHRRCFREDIFKNVFYVKKKIIILNM